MATLFDLEDFDEVPVPRPPRRRRQRRGSYVIRGGLTGTMWYGGWSISQLGYPRWRLWLKDALRFDSVEAARDVAHRVSGTVEARA